MLSFILSTENCWQVCVFGWGCLGMAAGYKDSIMLCVQHLQGPRQGIPGGMWFPPSVPPRTLLVVLMAGLDFIAHRERFYSNDYIGRMIFTKRGILGHWGSQGKARSRGPPGNPSNFKHDTITVFILRPQLKRHNYTFHYIF